MTRRIRIGIDTGGTFTDVVAFDEDSGELVTTKTPSTPEQPGRRVPRRHRQGARPARRRPAPTSTRSATAPRSRPTSCSRARSTGSASSPPSGYEAMLEIARQSVPDGYGNSYFWVKPPRIVPRDLVKGVERPARLHRRRGAALRRGRRPRGGPLVPGPGRQHARRLLPARLRQPGARGADARRARRGAPRRRGLAVERGAARVPRVRAGDDHPRRRGREAAALGVRHQHQDPARGPRRPGHPVLRDEVQRRRALGRRGRAPADHHRAVRPGRRCARRGADRQGRRLRPGAHLRRRGYVDRRLRGDRRRADADHRGLGRGVPVEDPDDRRRHRGCRRRLDRLALAGGHAQGRAAVGGRRPRPALLRQGRHRGHHHRRPRLPRPDPSAPARRRDPARRRRGPRRHRGAGRTSSA